MGYLIQSRYRSPEKARKKLGLVIHSSSFCWLEVIVFSTTDIEITAFDRVSYSSDAELSFLLSQSFKDQAISKCLVSVALKQEQVVMRHFPVSTGLSQIELDTFMEHSIKQYTSYAYDACYYDYYREPPTTKDQRMTTMHLVAARAELIQKHLTIIYKAGFKPLNVDVDVFAIQRAIQYLQNIKKMDIVCGSFPVFFLMELHPGMLRLFFVMKDSYEVRWKTSIPFSVEIELEKPTESLHRVLNQVKQALLEHATGHVFLIGEQTNSAIAGYIQQNLCIPTSVLNPLVGFSIGAGVNAWMLQTCAPTMLIPMGLVLRQDRQCS